MERRQYVGTIFALSIAGFSGCSGIDTGFTDPSGSNSDAPDETQNVEKNIIVTALSVSETTVTVGDSIQPTVTVKNTADEPDEKRVTLHVNQAVWESKDVSLDGNSSKTLDFDVKIKKPTVYTIVAEDLEEEVEAVATEVGGQITSDTTWSVNEGPYLITDTIQVPEDVTLTIDPGVTVWASEEIGRDSLFLLHGEITAEGTSSDLVRIDGNGTNSTFFDVDGSTPETFLSAEHCLFEDGGEFWMGGPGGFNLRHSELREMGPSYIWYPYLDTTREFTPPRTEINIEYNSFVDSGGFSVGLRSNQGQDDPTQVNIRYNRFEGWVEATYGGLLNNWNNRNNSEMVVEYNSFVDMIDEVVLALPEGYDNAALSAPNNYWGTTDENTIESMIYDERDNIDSAGIIEYKPILDEPHSDAPTQ